MFVEKAETLPGGAERQDLVEEAHTRVSTRPGGIVDLETAFSTPASCEAAWEVITDYDHLGCFVPQITSRTIGHTDNGTLVEGMTVSKKRIILEFVRESSERLSFRQIDGMFKRLDGFWRVTPEPQGARVTYRAEAEHGSILPGFIIASAVRGKVQKMIPIIFEEIRKRAAQPALETG